MKKEGCRAATFFTGFLLLLFGITAAAGAVFTTAAGDFYTAELTVFAAVIVSAAGYVATYRTIFLHIALLIAFILPEINFFIRFLLTFLPN